MNAFDTDVFSEILLGNAAYVSRLSLIPADQQAIPIIVAEEILRGRLNVIRRAEARKSKISVDLAYRSSFGISFSSAAISTANSTLNFLPAQR